MMTRKNAWIVAFTLPVWFAPLWVFGWRAVGQNFDGLATATIGLLLIMVTVAAHTDAKSRRIPNWISYTGVLWGLTINAIQSGFGNSSTQQFLGTIGFTNSLIGFAGLFFGLMIVFSFSGGGAGDVKLSGAIGSFLGLKTGFEVLLVSFVCCAVIVLGRTLIQLATGRESVSTTEKSLANKDLADADLLGEDLGAPKAPASANPMKMRVPLAPFFAMGTIIVVLREAGFLNFEIIGG